MSETSLILESAWRQLDTRRRGYISPSDLPLLIDAIEASLTLPLLDSQQLEQVKQYARTSVQRVHKSDFKALFTSLVGVDFGQAVKRAGWDAKAMELLQNELLTSTPIKKDNKENEIHPSFKKEYKQYKRLSESQEREIEYRDEVIHKLEKKESELEKYITKQRETAALAKELEEDVMYRDRVIIEKDSQIREKEKENLRLKDEVKRWKDESRMWQTQNEDEWKQYVAKKEQKFNAELLQKVQQQSKSIELLKRALSQRSAEVKGTPITIASTATKKNSPTSLIDNKLIYVVSMLLITLIFLCLPTNKIQGPWYQGTWIEPILHEWLENDSVDYEYYNLGSVNEEYLMSIR